MQPDQNASVFPIQERVAEREAMEVMTEVLARNMKTPGKGLGLGTPGGPVHTAGGSVL